MLDLGAILAHYCCDLTRTVYVGRVPSKIQRWYRAVKNARDAACHAIRAGVRAAEVDAAARAVLTKEKLERYFIHGTGHGIGLEVHEAPRLSRGHEAILETGNVVTVEPGVYVEGVGGIRIEDDVLVTDRGSEVLTRESAELVEL